MGEGTSGASFDVAVVERDPPGLVLADSAAGRIVRRISLPPHPRAVAVRPDRRFAYVVHDGPDPETEVGPPGRLISVVELDGGQVHGQRLEGLARPCDAAFDAEGRLHVLIAEGPTVLRGAQPNTGSYELARRLPPGRPQRLLPRGSGADVCVLDSAQARVLVQPLGEGGLTRPVVLPAAAQPGCMALSPDGRWLAVGGTAGPEISLIDAERLVYYPALQIAGAVADLAFDSDGGLHALGADGRLWQGGPQGVAPTEISGFTAFVRGRPAWALSEEALVEVAGAGRVEGLSRAVMAIAVA